MVFAFLIRVVSLLFLCFFSGPEEQKGTKFVAGLHCSGPPRNKKQSLEAEPTEKDALELKPELPRPTDVIGFSSSQSSTLTKGSTSSEEHLPSSSCSTTLIEQLSIGLINKRDSAHGSDVTIVNVKEGSFKPGK